MRLGEAFLRGEFAGSDGLEDSVLHPSAGGVENEVALGPKMERISVDIPVNPDPSRRRASSIRPL